MKTAFPPMNVFLRIMIPLAFWLGDTKIEIALMISSVLLVMAVELLNSAVEAVVDRIGTERHELSGRAKDQGSAASIHCTLHCCCGLGVFYFSKVRSIFSNKKAYVFYISRFLGGSRTRFYSSTFADINKKDFCIFISTGGCYAYSYSLRVRSLHSSSLFSLF